LPERLSFKPQHFDPRDKGQPNDEQGTVTFRSEFAGRETVYVYEDRTILAVNAALSLKRALLVSGEPGSGKSSLARNIAAVLCWRYYEKVVTSRTQAQDLLWEFDALRRVGDAQAGQQHLRPRDQYVEPRVLWWAFNPGDAERGGAAIDGPVFVNPSPAGDPNAAVVLVDEIDKADPDVPNDLLEILEARRFTVEETQHRVEQGDRQVLMIITTNRERELPPAFIRRCVCLSLGEPTEEWLVDVASRWLPGVPEPFLKKMATEIMGLRQTARAAGARAPSIAEYLDALRACADLTIETRDRVWEETKQLLLWKGDAPMGPA
jgi:MoxR-like ATPase